MSIFEFEKKSGRLLRWSMSIRTVIRLSRPYSGRYSAAGRSSPTLPSSTSWSTTAAVNVFDTEANANAVPVVIGTSSATLALPVVPAHARPSSHAMATEMPGMPVLRRKSSIARWRRLLGTPARGSLGVGVGVGLGCGASVALGVGSGVSSGAIEAPTSAVAVARSTGVALGSVVAPAMAMLSGFRLGVANTPVTASSAAMTATAAMPIPALERRTPEAPPRPAREDPSRRGGIGRACGERSRSVGWFGMMVRR